MSLKNKNKRTQKGKTKNTKKKVIYSFEFEVLTDDIFSKGNARINSYVIIKSSSLASAEKRLADIFNNNDLPIYNYKVVKEEKSYD